MAVRFLHSTTEISSDNEHSISDRINRRDHVQFVQVVNGLHSGLRYRDLSVAYAAPSGGKTTRPYVLRLASLACDVVPADDPPERLRLVTVATEIPLNAPAEMIDARFAAADDILSSYTTQPHHEFVALKGPATAAIPNQPLNFRFMTLVYRIVSAETPGVAIASKSVVVDSAPPDTTLTGDWEAFGLGRPPTILHTGTVVQKLQG